MPTDKPNTNRSHTYNLLNILFPAAYLFIVGVFFLGKVLDSIHKPFWGDEIFGLSVAKSSSYIHLLFQGAPGQASPAPLDYIAIKILDQIKDRVSYFGLAPEAYFRIFPITVTAFSVLAIAFIFIKEIKDNKAGIGIKTAQLFLLLCLPIAYLFQPYVNYFAAEMRPYALWNSLFIITLAASFSGNRNRKLLFASATLLAFSATAAIFQIIAVALAYVVAHPDGNGGARDAIKPSFRLFIIPFIVALYYCLKAGKLDMVSAGGTWKDFIDMWMGKAEMILIILLAAAACLIKSGNRRRAVPALTFLILFFMGPVIFLITRLNGFFFTGRQFIYYDLARAVLIMTLIICLPDCIKDIRSRRMAAAVLIILCLAAAGLTFRPKVVKKFKAAAMAAMEMVAGDKDRAVNG